MKRTPLKRTEFNRKPMKQRTNKHGIRLLPDTSGVITYPDGREKCDKSRKGEAEYRRRVCEMLIRQNGYCGLQISDKCPKALPLEMATFDHQDGRGMNGGHRDDRIERDGKPYNLAACYWCNAEKGSRRLETVRDADPLAGGDVRPL